MSARKTKIGIIGCGNISRAYFERIRLFGNLETVACADADPERAQVAGEKWDVRAGTVDELLADGEIEIVVNLTVPQAHAEVAMRVLQAGRHVFSEKPLALELADGRDAVKVAGDCGRRVGCAPDTRYWEPRP